MRMEMVYQTSQSLIKPSGKKPSALSLLAPLLRLQAHKAIVSQRPGSQEGRGREEGTRTPVSGTGDCLVLVIIVLEGGLDLE